LKSKKKDPPLFGMIDFKTICTSQTDMIKESKRDRGIRFNQN